MSIPAIFRDWALAEMAAHYAQPCPDEVMDALVEQYCAHSDRLAATPATNEHDLLLKIFPVLLANLEPANGEHPLVLNPDDPHVNGRLALIRSVAADLTRLCPEIAEAVSLEWPGKRRAA